MSGLDVFGSDIPSGVRAAPRGGIRKLVFCSSGSSGFSSDITLLFIFRPPNLPEVYHSLFPIICSKMVFSSCGSMNYTLRYAPRIAFGYAIYKGFKWEEVKSGDSTSLGETCYEKRFLSVTHTPGTQSVSCKNNTNGPINLWLGIIQGEDNQYFKPIMCWKDLKPYESVTTEPTFSLEAYVVSNAGWSADSAILYKKPETKPVWSLDLSKQRDSVSVWDLCEDDKSGAITAEANRAGAMALERGRLHLQVAGGPRILYFHSHFKREATMLLVFQPPHSSLLYRDIFPIVWERLKFKAGEPNVCRLYRRQQSPAFSFRGHFKAISVGDTLSIRQRQKEICAGSITPSSTQVVTCKNETKSPQDVKFGLLKHYPKSQYFEATAIWKNLQHGESASVQYEPRLQAYITDDPEHIVDYSGIITKKPEIRPVWTCLLDELDNVTAWDVFQDEESDSYKIKQTTLLWERYAEV